MYTRNIKNYRFFFRKKTIKRKINMMVGKTCILRFHDQIYKKRKQHRCRRLEQETRLQKFRQIDKTNVDQKRHLYINN